MTERGNSRIRRPTHPDIRAKQEEKACFDLVEKGKDKIIAMAKALLEKNHLNQDEIAELLAE